MVKRAPLSVGLRCCGQASESWRRRLRPFGGAVPAGREEAGALEDPAEEATSAMQVVTVAESAVSAFIWSLMTEASRMTLCRARRRKS